MPVVKFVEKKTWTIEDLIERSQQKGRGIRNSAYYWRSQLLPTTGIVSIEQINLFGRAYECLDCSHGRVKDLWYVPKDRYGIAINFASDRMEDFVRFQMGLKSYAELDLEEIVDPYKDRGETYWWCDGEFYCGPVQVTTGLEAEIQTFRASQSGPIDRIELVWIETITTDKRVDSVEVVADPVETVRWQPVKPGNILAYIGRLTRSASQKPDSELERISAERLGFLHSLSKNWHRGTRHNGSTAYFVAEFKTGWICECLEYRNAMYFLPKTSSYPWQEVFTLRLKRDMVRRGAIQIVHDDKYKEEVLSLINS